MEHISPQTLMTRASMTPDPMFAMDDFMCIPQHSLSVTKPVKKRKSWGQELPEPKTALPPRKRAKTEDEKEQRRIERIKRNRAAAHNSRERKRIEAEHLATANDALVKQIQALRHRVAVQDAQLAKCKEQLGGSLPELSGEETASYDRRFSEQSSSPSPCSSTIDPRASLSCSTPATTPDTTPYIKMEDHMATPDPESFNHNDALLFGSLDQTQHSAAMLCDLQCRSGESAISQLSHPSTPQAWAWTHTILFLMHLSVMNIYKSSLLALWTHSPAQMTNLLTALRTGSTLTPRRPQSTTPSLTPLPSWWTLARHLLAATVPSTQASSALALTGLQKNGLVLASRSSGRPMDEQSRSSLAFKDNIMSTHLQEKEHNGGGETLHTDQPSSYVGLSKGESADKASVVPPE